MFRKRPRSSWPLGLLVCLALPCLAAPTAAASNSADVARAIGQLPATGGAQVWNISDGKLIAQRRAGTERILASNTKLFTGAAALVRFGTGGRFSTGVYSRSRPVNGRVAGSVYLRGGGDPLFGTRAFVTANFGSRATIEHLVADLRRAGVKRITGGVYGDQSVFDRRRGTSYSGWRTNSDIGGMLGGLIVNKGFASGGYQASPATYAARRLHAALRASGIKVGRAIGSKRTPNDVHRLAAVRSLPISALVRQMNKPSNNYLAEMLGKAVGMTAAAADDDSDGGEVPLAASSSTTARGTRNIERFAARLGSSVHLADGSGLSRGDRAAPQEIVDLLRGIRRLHAYDDFFASLPIAGVDGTLKNRMRGTAAHHRCRAKTGTLSNVSSLSGYCRTLGGDLIAFSIVQNYVSTPAAKAREDRIAATIARLN